MAMRSAGWAFAWEFWSLHRWTIAPALAYLLVLAVLFGVAPAGTFGPMIGGQLSLPLVFALAYILAAFTHGEQGAIESADSLFPRRAFTLPVPTTALAGWPLLLGGALVALYWLGLAGLVWRPCGVAAPLWWPTVALAAILAWLQALMWSPYPLPFLRIIVLVPVVCGLAVALLTGVHYEVPAPLLVVGSLLLLAVGYALSVVGLARARRGDGAPWRLWSPGRRPADGRSPDGADSYSRALPPFASPRRALSWFGWRRVGYAMPLMCGMVIVPSLLLLFVARDAQHGALVVLVMPGYALLMAGSAGLGMGSYHHSSRSNTTLTPFIASRPVTTATLVADRLRLVLLSIAFTWGSIYLLIAITVTLSRAAAPLVEGWQQVVDRLGVKAWLYLALAALVPPVIAWKQAVSNLWVPMTGRRWVAYLAGLAMAIGLTALGIVIALSVIWQWGTNSIFMTALSWMLAAVVLLKLALGALVVRALLRRGLVAPGTLHRWGAVWLGAAVGLFVLAFVLTPAEMVSPVEVGCTAVLLLLPLVRLGLAPLALDWNRHR
jgi:hypothetical protein